MTYNLVLPKGFIEMDQDEMSYVDGGWTTGQNKVWFVPVGWWIKFTKAECQQISTNMNGVATIAGLATAGINVALAVFIGATLFCAQYLFEQGAKKNGIKFDFAFLCGIWGVSY